MPPTGTNETLGGGGFHHIAIRAWDYDKTLRFYTETLGFKRRYGWGSDDRADGGKDSRAAMLDTGDGNYLELFAGRQGDPNTEIPEGGLIHFCLRTDDPAAAYHRAVSGGAAGITEPKKVIPPNCDYPIEFWIAFVRGFDGEVIEFFHSEEL